MKPCKCGSTDLYPNGRCKPCSRAQAARWKAENKPYVAEQKRRARAKALRADRDALYRRVWALRTEADRLEKLL